MVKVISCQFIGAHGFLAEVPVKLIISVKEGTMGYFKNAMRCVAIVLCMVSALALFGCAMPGKTGEVSKFDSDGVSG